MKIPSTHKGLPIERDAISFASLRHAGQQYNVDEPYTIHLEAVKQVLIRFGYTDAELMCAAWLHDSIEDTNTSYGDIRARFGEEVAELVYAVTSELGRNRKERNEKTYPKLVNAGERAMVLKLADRIANVEYGAATGGKNAMYAKEFPAFEHALRYVEVSAEWDRGTAYADRLPELEPMWNHLARLLGGLK